MVRKDIGEKPERRAGGRVLLMGARSSRSLEEHFPEPFARQFRVLAAQRGMTTKALLAEAISEKMAKQPEEIPPARPADVRQAD